MRTIITLLFLSLTLLAQAQRGGGGHHGHHGHHHNYPVPMSSVEFSQAMNQMDRESFDDGKLRIAKGIINGNYLLSQQVKALVGEFTFKDKQEELALYAYPKTYDQNKYYMVYEAFTFDSSKDKVSEWVSEQPINDYQGSNYYGPRPITDADFAQGLRHVKAESFDDGKLRVAKQLIDGNYIYADQVAVLIKEFDFKANEEAIAKHAYKKTYDQKNYYLVYDAFTFDSSKEELERWLDGQPIRDHARPQGNGHGHNHGNGNGHNHGNGYGNGHNHGNGNGHNHGNGYANGNNNGNGHGHGNNNGNGHGHGNNNGNGHGHGNNNGHGHGNNNGHGHGNNNGNGHGNNHGNGFGNDLPPNSSNPNLGNNNTNTNNNSGNNNSNWNDDNPNGNVTIGQNNTNNNNSQGGGIQAMSARDFDTMKTRILEFASDNDRINKAKEYLPNNFLLAEQVKEIMGLFVFEDVRLDFAKSAYGKTFDPQSYRLVKDFLVNPNSKQDLQSYIDNY